MSTARQPCRSACSEPGKACAACHRRNRSSGRTRPWRAARRSSRPPVFPNDPADIGPIENIEINGGQAINFDAQDPVVAHAVRISTQHPRMLGEDRRLARIGVQLVVPPAVFNSRSAKIETSVIQGCYTGIAVSSDQEVLGNTILACRDYGLIAPNPAGNVTIANNHFYGCNGKNEHGEYDGKCVYMPNGSGWRLVGNTLADSHYGFVSGGGGSHTTIISACTFFKNSKCAIQINGGTTNFRIDGCTINVPPGTDDEQFSDIRGVELAGNRNSVSDSVFFLDGVATSGLPGTPNAGRSTALRVSGHANTCVNTVFLTTATRPGRPAGFTLPRPCALSPTCRCGALKIRATSSWPSTTPRSKACTS